MAILACKLPEKRPIAASVGSGPITAVRLLRGKWVARRQEPSPVFPSTGFKYGVTLDRSVSAAILDSLWGVGVIGYFLGFANDIRRPFFRFHTGQVGCRNSSPGRGRGREPSQVNVINGTWTGDGEQLEDIPGSSSKASPRLPVTSGHWITRRWGSFLTPTYDPVF